jgi:hypothetical protein
MIAFCAILLGAMAAAVPPQSDAPDVLAVVDHIVYATPDLELGIQKLEALLGVRAAPGGQHPGRGTRNALIALKTGRYLEIIGPDLEQPKPSAPRTFGIDDLKEPRLVAWAAKAVNLERLASDAKSRGVALGDVASGSRRRPDGVLLSWRYTTPQAALALAGGVVPFFIDWGTTPHPSETAAGGATLAALRAEHPEVERVAKLMQQLGVPLPVRSGPRPALLATVDCPRGRVELR